MIGVGLVFRAVRDMHHAVACDAVDLPAQEQIARRGRGFVISETRERNGSAQGKEKAFHGRDGTQGVDFGCGITGLLFPVHGVASACMMAP